MKNDIGDIIGRIEKLEKSVFGVRKEGRKPRSGSSGSLPDQILGLRDTGFFKQPKTAQEIHTKLQPAYACESDRVAMALLRLKNKKNLRVTSKVVGGKKIKAYVW